MSSVKEQAQKFIDWRKKRMSTQQTPVAGHNSNAEMKSILERWENLETEKRSFADEIKDLRTEAKGKGFDPKALAVIVKERMMDADKLAAKREQEEVVDNYRAALGMLA